MIAQQCTYAWGTLMSQFVDWLDKHGNAVTAFVGCLGIVFTIIVFVFWAGALASRVASAEETVKTLDTKITKITETDEARVVRLHDKIDHVVDKIDNFVKDAHQHTITDSENSKAIAINLQKMASDIEAIRTQLDKRSSRK
jgi:predicted PurR-regulated permease PerM